MKHKKGNHFWTNKRFFKLFKQSMICIIILIMFYTLNTINHPITQQIEKKVSNTFSANYQIMPMIKKAKQWHIPKNTLEIPAFEEHLGPLKPIIQEWKKEDFSSDYRSGEKESQEEKEVVKETLIKEEASQKKNSVETQLEPQKQDEKEPTEQVMAIPVDGILSSAYGWRVHPIYKDKRFHEGVDIFAPEGKSVYAVLDGTVKEVCETTASGWVVKVDHERGLETRYAHCLKILVKEREKVKKGQIIAQVGNTGISTGPHLHFEILENDKNVNPEEYIHFKRK